MRLTDRRTLALLLMAVVSLGFSERAGAAADSGKSLLETAIHENASAVSNLPPLSYHYVTVIQDVYKNAKSTVSGTVIMAQGRKRITAYIVLPQDGDDVVSNKPGKEDIVITDRHVDMIIDRTHTIILDRPAPQVQEYDYASSEKLPRVAEEGIKAFTGENFLITNGPYGIGGTTLEQISKSQTKSTFWEATLHASGADNGITLNRFIKPRQLFTSVHIAPGQGYAITRQTGYIAGGVAFYESDSKVQKLKDNKTWFPTKVVESQFDAYSPYPKNIKVQTTTTFDHVMLLAKVDSSTFKMSSLPIPEGTAIYDTDGNGQKQRMVWKNGVAVPEPSSDHPAAAGGDLPVAEMPREAPRSFIADLMKVALATIVVAAIGAGVYWLRRKRTAWK